VLDEQRIRRVEQQRLGISHELRLAVLLFIEEIR
jgi:hypothetical protein